MNTGTVKWFDDRKGFGFIQKDGGGPDIFVHKSAVDRAGLRTLMEGQKITFDVQKDPKNNKESAANIKVAA